MHYLVLKSTEESFSGKRRPPISKTVPSSIGGDDDDEAAAAASLGDSTRCLGKGGGGESSKKLGVVVEAAYIYIAPRVCGVVCVVSRAEMATVFPGKIIWKILPFGIFLLPWPEVSVLPRFFLPQPGTLSILTRREPVS